MSPQPTDIKLYEKVKRKIMTEYPTHSAYRSGLIVKAYKKAYEKKYGNVHSAYVGKKPVRTGLVRWFEEDWRNQRGEIGMKYKSDIYRPTKRVTHKTPTTLYELTPTELNRARREKSRTRRVSRFRTRD